MIVTPEPSRCVVLNFSNRAKQELVQPVVANRPVVTFNIGILLWLAWLDMIDTDILPLCPGKQYCTDVLRTVVTPNRSRLSSPLNDLLQRANDPFSRQREIHLNAQSLTIEIVDDIEQSIGTTILQAVVHEVHRPNLIDVVRHG